MGGERWRGVEGGGGGQRREAGREGRGDEKREECRQRKKCGCDG